MSLADNRCQCMNPFGKGKRQPPHWHRQPKPELGAALSRDPSSSTHLQEQGFVQEQTWSQRESSFLADLPPSKYSVI